jgi:hypothetical protein
VRIRQIAVIEAATAQKYIRHIAGEPRPERNSYTIICFPRPATFDSATTSAASTELYETGGTPVSAVVEYSPIRPILTRCAGHQSIRPQRSRRGRRLHEASACQGLAGM